MWAHLLADSESLGIPSGILSGGALALLGLVLAFQAKSSRDSTVRSKDELKRLAASRTEEEDRRREAEKEKDALETELTTKTQALSDAQWHIRILEEQIRNQKP